MISFHPKRRLRQASLLFSLACTFLAPAPALAAVTPPSVVSQVPVAWPDGADASKDLDVVVTVTVGVDGQVTTAQADPGAPPGVAEAAVDNVKRWTFNPAERDGLPIPAKIKAVVHFAAPSAATSVAATPAVPAPATPETPIAAPSVPPTTVSVAAVSPPVAAAPAPSPAADAAAPIQVRVQGDAPPRSASDVVVQKDVLTAAPHKNAGEMLYSVPGVFVSAQSGQGKAHQIFLRGFDAVQGQDIEIWAGGAPVNEVSNLFGQGYSDLNFIIPEVVKNVRATPGAYDPRQGDFAVAGSLEFELGYDEPGATAAVTMGSFGERRYFLAYHPDSTSEDTFVAFETQSSDGFGPARAARRTAAIAQGSYDITATTSLRLLGAFYAGAFASAGVVRLRDVEDGVIDRFDTYDPKQGGDSSRAQVVLALTSFDDAAGSDWSLAPYYVLRELRLRNNYTGYLEDSVNGDSYQHINESTTIGVRGHYKRRLPLFSEKDTLEVGFLARTDWIDQEQLRLSTIDDHVTQRAIDAQVRASDLAGYFDAALRPVKRVTLRAGLRVDGLFYAVQDQVSDVSDPNRSDDAGAARASIGTHFGKKATADVVIWRGLHGLVSFGDGFRSPQARSLGDGEKTPFTEVISTEAGLRYTEGSTLRATLAGFYTTLSDDLVFDEATARNERVASTRRIGAAADVLLHATDWLLSTGSITYTRASFTASDARNQEGNLVPYVPQLIARIDSAATPVVTQLWRRDLRLHAGAGMSFMAARPLPFGDFGHDTLLFDASTGLRLKEVELRVDMHNVLGAKYYDGEYVYASNFSRGSAPELVPLRHVTAGAPRSIFATLKLYL